MEEGQYIEYLHPDRQMEPTITDTTREAVDDVRNKLLRLSLFPRDIQKIERHFNQVPDVSSLGYWIYKLFDSNQIEEHETDKNS